MDSSIAKYAAGMPRASDSSGARARPKVGIGTRLRPALRGLITGDRSLVGARGRLVLGGDLRSPRVGLALGVGLA